MSTNVSSDPAVPSFVMEAARNANWWVQRRASRWGTDVSSPEGFAISLGLAWQAFTEGKDSFTCACSGTAYWARQERENAERVCYMPSEPQFSVGGDPVADAALDTVEVRSLLDCIPSRLKKLAILLFEDYTQREIARLWRISTARVHQLVDSLRESIRKHPAASRPAEKS